MPLNPQAACMAASGLAAMPTLHSSPTLLTRDASSRAMRRGRAIEPLQSIEIEQQSVGMRVFHARCKRMRDIEQRGV